MTKGGPAEPGFIVPCTAFDHLLPVGEPRGSPLKDVSHGVEQAVGTRPRRVSGHRRGAAGSPCRTVQPVSYTHLTLPTTPYV